MRARSSSLIFRLTKLVHSLLLRPGVGVGWNYQGQGTATPGVNPAKARAVAKAAAITLLNDRRRSLRVVAMNIKQAQRISDELQAIAKGYPVLAKILNEAENSTRGEPFFIKNLENVQGDARYLSAAAAAVAVQVPWASVMAVRGELEEALLAQSELPRSRGEDGAVKPDPRATSPQRARAKCGRPTLDGENRGGCS